MSEVDITALTDTELKALGWEQLQVREGASRAVAAIEQELSRRRFELLNAPKANEQNPDGGMGNDKGDGNG